MCSCYFFIYILFLHFFHLIHTRVHYFFEFLGSIIVKPTIVESQLLRASSTKRSIASHLLSKYRTCLEACFEEEELREYVRKEHSFLQHSRKEYSLRGSERGGDRDFRGSGTLPNWLTDRRGSDDRDLNYRNNDNYDNYNDYNYSNNNSNDNMAFSNSQNYPNNYLTQNHRFETENYLSPKSNAKLYPHLLSKNKNDYDEKRNFNSGMLGPRSQDNGWLFNRTENEKKFNNNKNKNYGNNDRDNYC